MGTLAVFNPGNPQNVAFDDQGHQQHCTGQPDHINMETTECKFGSNCNLAELLPGMPGMRQSQAATNRKEAYCTPKIPEIFLLSMTESVASVRTAAALHQTDE